MLRGHDDDRDGSMARSAWILTLAVCAAGLLAPTAAHAQSKASITTIQTEFGERQLGSQFRPAVSRAADIAARGEQAEARRLLAPALAWCDQVLAQPRRAVSVATAAEYQAWMHAHGDGQPVDWIDGACPHAYKSSAFVHVELKQFDAALADLDKAIKIAPYWADAHAEAGFILTGAAGSAGAKQPGQGLERYRQAVALAEQFPSNAHMKPLALRGVGYSLVELGRLDEAEQAYKQALELEPGNAIARSELDYIREQREAATSAQEKIPGGK